MPGMHSKTGDAKYVHGSRTWRRVTLFCRPARGRPVMWISPDMRGVPEETILLVRRLFIANPAKLTAAEFKPLLADTPQMAKIRKSIVRGERAGRGKQVARYMQELGFITYSEHRELSDPGWRRRWILMLRGMGSRYVPKWARPGTEYAYLIDEIDGKPDGGDE